MSKVLVAGVFAVVLSFVAAPAIAQEDDTVNHVLHGFGVPHSHRYEYRHHNDGIDDEDHHHHFSNHEHGHFSHHDRDDHYDD